MAPCGLAKKAMLTLKKKTSKQTKQKQKQFSAGEGVPV